MTAEQAAKDLWPAVSAAAHALARGDRFDFTRAQLYFELVRGGVLPDPGQDPDGALASFAAMLEPLEQAHGELPNLIRPERLEHLPPPPELPPDVLDYSVRRVLVFDRIDTCLCFIRNGFHRRIEVGLVVWPSFPAHIWARLHSQIESGLVTEFFLIGDCSATSRKWKADVHAALGKRPNVRIRDAAMTFPWAFRLRLPVRSTGKAPDPEVPIPDHHEWRGLLMVGSYASLQEMPPIRLLRWVYRRVARGAEDVGFG